MTSLKLWRELPSLESDGWHHSHVSVLAEAESGRGYPLAPS